MNRWISKTNLATNFSPSRLDPRIFGRSQEFLQITWNFWIFWNFSILEIFARVRLELLTYIYRISGDFSSISPLRILNRWISKVNLAINFWPSRLDPRIFGRSQKLLHFTWIFRKFNFFWDSLIFTTPTKKLLTYIYRISGDFLGFFIELVTKIHENENFDFSFFFKNIINRVIFKILQAENYFINFCWS